MMNLINIQRAPDAPLEVINELLLEKLDRIDHDNAHELTHSREYYLHGKLVHRSAHVQLREWPGGLALDFGQLAGRGITPSGQEPGRPSQRELRRLAHLMLGGARFANSQAMASQFKVDILNGLHAFGASVVRGATTKDGYSMALYLVSASRGAGDTVYNTTGELAASGNYTQGGNAVTTGTAPTLSGTTAIFTPSASVSWAALTSSGAFDATLLYNTTSSTKLAVAVFTFGSQTVTAGTFTLTMPVNDASNALIRIA